MLNTDYEGAVTISPSGNSLVCDGDQLELICMVTDSGNGLLEWAFLQVYRAIDASTLSDQTSHIMINSTTFTFSRISAQNEFLLVSRLLINPLTTDLNRIMINCTDVITMETTSTTVYVLNRPHSTSGTWYDHNIVNREIVKLILENFKIATLLL